MGCQTSLNIFYLIFLKEVKRNRGRIKIVCQTNPNSFYEVKIIFMSALYKICIFVVKKTLFETQELFL
jgi:hypothetical protein